MSRSPLCAMFWLVLLGAAIGGCDRGSEGPDASGGKAGVAATPAAEPGWDAPANVPARSWKWIVIHHSGEPVGSYAAIDNYHRDSRGWDGCGYHFVIGNGVARGTADGVVEVGARWRQQKHGAHAGSGFPDFNQHGVGVCLIGNFDVPAAVPAKSTKPGHSAEPDAGIAPGTRATDAQMDALARLVRYLCWKHQIPRDNVIGHKQVRIGNGPAKNTACPGRYFSMEELQARLAALDGRPTIGPAPAAVAQAH